MVYIPIMREVNIASLDLNLLVALKALLDEKHVTKAAEKVGLSQPAMSRALARLRLMFKDQLLVKSAGGMALTARALDLCEPLDNILSQIGRIMISPTSDPAGMQGEISIGTRDYEMAAIMPEIIADVCRQAPGLKLKILALAGNDLGPLERHDYDFVISGTDKSSTTLMRKTLFQDNFVCLLASDHPLSKKKLTLERYLEMRHCLISFNDSRPGIVDTTLSAMGEKRKVAVSVPHFLTASYLVAKSDLAVSLPRRLALQLARQEGLVAKELPFTTPSFSIYLYWHIRNQNNPVHSWLRKTILKQAEA